MEWKKRVGYTYPSTVIPNYINLCNRDGHKLAHEVRFVTNFGWVTICEMVFVEGHEHFTNFGAVYGSLW